MFQSNAIKMCRCLSNEKKQKRKNNKWWSFLCVIWSPSICFISITNTGNEQEKCTSNSGRACIRSVQAIANTRTDGRTHCTAFTLVFICLLAIQTLRAKRYYSTQNTAQRERRRDRNTHTHTRPAHMKQKRTTRSKCTNITKMRASWLLFYVSVFITRALLLHTQHTCTIQVHVSIYFI